MAVTPIYSDHLTYAVSQTGQSLTVGQALAGSLNAYFPQSLYVGMIVAPSWTASTAVTSGATYVTAGNPNVFATTNRRVYVCSATGTTGATEPTWVQSPPGSVTTDGTALWVEASPQFNGTRSAYDTPTFTNAEPTDSAYARAPVTNSMITLGDTVHPNPTLVWPTSTQAWGDIVGLFISDAATGGNIWHWAVLPSLFPVTSGVTPVLTLPIMLSTATAPPAPPPPGTAVTLAQSAITNWPNAGSSTASARTVILSGVTSGDTLVLAVSLFAGATIAVSSVSSTGSPSWTKINSRAAGNGEVEWWYAPSAPAGTNVITVTPNAAAYFGMWAGELSAAGVPVSGMTDFGVNTNSTLLYTAMTVATPNSWVAVASVSTATETNGTGLGVFSAGPQAPGLGGQVAGLTYGAASANTSAAIGWTTVGNSVWATAGIVIPPA
jgi:hypothetical protein